ncbi:MAG: hypothetical protein JWN14_532 [Chthonomonadales bacterium]|nr:hypothetical protein [Chthonomonadales bacterium]
MVAEHCTAGGNGYAYNSCPTGTSTDGFGDSSTITQQTSTTITINCSNYRSSVHSGSSFTVTCSPSATMSGTMCSLYASVSYSAAATPVVVNMSGVTTVGTTKNILIGQGTTVSLSMGNYVPTVWAWDLSGDPFAGFQQAPTNEGHAVELTATDKTHATVPYFYRSIGNKGAQPPAGQSSQVQTVTCAATIPNLNPKLDPVQVTVSTNVTVYQPDHTFKGDKGHVVLYPAGGVVNIGAISDGVSPNGIDWKGSVTTPSMFIGEQGNGTWNYTQLVKPSVSYTQNGVVHTDPLSYNLKGLDDSFPYAGPYMADGTEYRTGDNPYQPLTSAMSRVDFVMKGWTWMLYQPPSYDSTTPTTFVPMHEFDWTAAGIATCNGISWTLLAGAGISTTDIGPTSVLPDWTQIIIPHLF